MLCLLLQKNHKRKKKVNKALNSSLLISFCDKPFLLLRISSLSCFFPSLSLQNQVIQPHLEKQKKQKNGFKLNRETKRKMIQGYPRTFQEVTTFCRNYCRNVIHDIEAKLQVSSEKSQPVKLFLHLVSKSNSTETLSLFYHIVCLTAGIHPCFSSGRRLFSKKKKRIRIYTLYTKVSQSLKIKVAQPKWSYFSHELVKIKIELNGD